MIPTRDIEVTCGTCGTKFSCTYEEEVHFVCRVCQARTSLKAAEARVREAEELMKRARKCLIAFMDGYRVNDFLLFDDIDSFLGMSHFMVEEKA